MVRFHLFCSFILSVRLVGDITIFFIISTVSSLVWWGDEPLNKLEHLVNPSHSSHTLCYTRFHFIFYSNRIFSLIRYKIFISSCFPSIFMLECDARNNAFYCHAFELTTCGNSSTARRAQHFCFPHFVAFFSFFTHFFAIFFTFFSSRWILNGKPKHVPNWSNYLFPMQIWMHKRKSLPSRKKNTHEPNEMLGY